MLLMITFCKFSISKQLSQIFAFTNYMQQLFQSISIFRRDDTYSIIAKPPLSLFRLIFYITLAILFLRSIWHMTIWRIICFIFIPYTIKFTFSVAFTTR